jgi:hypothetical protein
VAKKWTTKVFRNIDMLFNIFKDLQRGWEEGGEHVAMTRGEPANKILHRKRKQQEKRCQWECWQSTDSDGCNFQ